MDPEICCAKFLLVCAQFLYRLVARSIMTRAIPAICDNYFLFKHIIQLDMYQASLYAQTGSNPSDTISHYISLFPVMSQQWDWAGVRQERGGCGGEESHWFDRT